MRIVLLSFILPLLMISPGRALAEKSLTVVALGDSITAGTPGFRSPAEDPPEGSGNPESQYAYWIMKKHPDWKVLNRGVAGEQSGRISDRFERDVIAHRPDAVVVMAGVNDLFTGHSAESVILNLEKIYARAAKAGILVVACTILPYDSVDARTLERMKQVNGWIRRASKKNGFGFCDTYGALEHPKHPGQLISSADGLHPDVDGHRRLGDLIAAELERMFA